MEPGVRRVDCIDEDVDIGWGEAKGMVSQVPEVEDEPAATAGVALMELLGVDIKGVGLDEGGEMATQGVDVGGSAGAFAQQGGLMWCFTI